MPAARSSSKSPFTYGPLQASQAWHRAARCLAPIRPVYTIGAGHRANSTINMAASICVMLCVCWSLFLNSDDVTRLRWPVCNNYENSNFEKLFDVALVVNSRRHNSADCVAILAFLY